MTARRVPDLFVEQLAAGELAPDRAQAVRRALEAAGELHRLDAIQRDNAATRATLPPRQVAREVAARVAQRQFEQRKASWRAGPLVAVLLATGVALGVFRSASDAEAPLPDAQVASAQDGIRLKGLEPGLVVFRRDGEEGVVIDRDDVVADGDEVQVAYHPAGMHHGVILSVDGRGVVTLHHPGRADASTELADNVFTPLDHGYRLDDAPVHETFLFLASDAPIDVEAALSAAEERGVHADFFDETGRRILPVVRRVAKGASP